MLVVMMTKVIMRIVMKVMQTRVTDVAITQNGDDDDHSDSDL